MTILLACGFYVANGNTIREDSTLMGYEVFIAPQDSISKVVMRPKKKGVAITLAVTLGVFGVHRLYLGTKPKTPVIYTLTLGGGFGVLMLADLVAIIASKDVNEYSPNDKVFMWAK